MKRANDVSVIISGCHAGPNPSAGLGIARSLRQAFPTSVLIAKDHSVECTGLHAPEFDDVWVCPSWDQVDLESHRVEIQKRLDAGAWFISTLDLEVQWLGQTMPSRALLPSNEALRRASKPVFEAASRLPVRIPDHLPLSASESQIYAFCQRHGWRIWAKGASYEAKRVSNWSELNTAVDGLRLSWGSDDLFIQADVRGWEVSIAFAAFHGELLGAAFMEKRLLTETGKTWAGAVSDVPRQTLQLLRDLVAQLNWTGGAELEFVKDREDVLWLIDWNPRFPAWVFGLTIAGRNLPGKLLAAAAGIMARESKSKGSEFIRVVTEVPVRPGLVLPSPSASPPERTVAGKHLSGMPMLMRRLAQPSRRPLPTEPTPLVGPMADDIVDLCSTRPATPCRVLLGRTAQLCFRNASMLVEQLSDVSQASVRLAYSVKTNPSEEFMQLARSQGFLAEVISESEVAWALDNGFDASDIIYNGPVPLTRQNPGTQLLRAVFADSVQSFWRYAHEKTGRYVGLRLCPPFVDSRFGIRMEEPREFQQAVDALRSVPSDVSLGISLHIQPSQVGIDKWVLLVRSALEFASALEKLSGRDVGILNLGGGYGVEGFEEILLTKIPSLILEAQARMVGIKEFILEPGKSLCEPCCAVVSSVLEIRTRGAGKREVVVDTSVAEVPHVGSFPHRMLAVSDESCEHLGPGEDRILGCLCMENDVLAARVLLPPWLTKGDMIVICDSGAYDASMAYRFGRGAKHDNGFFPPQPVLEQTTAPAT